LKYCIPKQNAEISLSGRSKRNTPLPIFKNDPMGRNSEYTYKGAIPLRLSHQGLLVESSISEFENITCLKGRN
jgi:hypothetical protein